MTFVEKKNVLDEIWTELVNYMANNYDYTEMASCNKDYSRYLVKSGTEGEVTYQGKPQYSLRISDHWNWRNERKAPGKIQCALYGVREPKIGDKPLMRIEIGFYKDGIYHFVCGERKGRRGEWLWDCPSVADICSRVVKYMD